MLCPRCVHGIHRGAQTCPNCEFSLTDADAQFGNKDFPVATLSDTAGLLRLANRRKVQATIDHFSTQFPQLFFAIHIRSFPFKREMSEYAFWAFNHSVFEDLEPQKTNAGGVLLVMDANSKTASIAYGYLLDAYLTEEDTFACLLQAHAFWVEDQFAEGIIALVKHITAILIRKHRKHKNSPKQLLRSTQSKKHISDLAQRIRDVPEPSSDMGRGKA